MDRGKEEPQKAAQIETAGEVIVSSILCLYNLDLFEARPRVTLSVHSRPFDPDTHFTLLWLLNLVGGLEAPVFN